MATVNYAAVSLATNATALASPPLAADIETMFGLMRNASPRLAGVSDAELCLAFNALVNNSYVITMPS